MHESHIDVGIRPTTEKSSFLRRSRRGGCQDTFGGLVGQQVLEVDREKYHADGKGYGGDEFEQDTDLEWIQPEFFVVLVLRVSPLRLKLFADFFDLSALAVGNLLPYLQYSAA